MEKNYNDDFLVLLSLKITSVEKADLVRDTPDFHEPNPFSYKLFWSSLETCNWITNNLLDLTFVTGNVLLSLDVKKEKNYMDLYVASLFIRSFSNCSSGVEFMSLAVRLLLEFDFQKGDKKLSYLIQNFINDSIENYKGEESQIYFLELGLLYFDNKNAFIEEVRSESVSFLSTFSGNCPDKYKTFCQKLNT